jgi:hypothetical protein
VPAQAKGAAGAARAIMGKQMGKFRQLVATGLVAVAVLLGLHATGNAVLAFLDGNSYRNASRDYQLGYMAGSVDMLRALQDAGKVGPPDFNAQALAIINCVEKSTDVNIDKMYADYLQKNPDRIDRSTASAVYNSMRVACNIN